MKKYRSAHELEQSFNDMLKKHKELQLDLERQIEEFRTYLNLNKHDFL